jgi:ABC-type transporter Mla subunit MlaD
VNPLAIATFPLTLAHQLESLLTQLGQVASRAVGLLDVAEPVAQRVDALTTKVDALVARAGGITSEVDQATAGASRTLEDVRAIVRELDAADLRKLLDDAVGLVPALAGLPPVIERLAEQVDHLDKTVGEVSTLLQGVPGAARLVKRGAGLTGR